MASKSSTKKAAQTRGATLITPSQKPRKSSFGQNGGEALGTKRSTGASFHQTGAALSPTQTSSSKPPPAAPLVQPFLTPAQQKALDDWNTRYGNNQLSLNQADKDAAANYATGLQNDELTNAQNVDMTNQNAAARGIFQSSIRDNALNDLATTLAQQENILQTTRDTTLFNDQISRGNATADNAANQAYFSGLAVTNAQGVTPTTAPVTNTVATHPNSVAPAGASGPTPTGPPQPEPQTSTNAATQRATTPTPQHTTGASLTFGAPSTGARLTIKPPGLKSTGGTAGVSY